MIQPMTYWSISSQVLKEEAEKLGLSVEILQAEKNLFFVRWNGKEMLFKSTDFWWNSSLSTKIVNDKELTYILLDRYGFPIARSLYMDESVFSNFDWTELANFCFPLVIKPIDEWHGNGVCMNIATIPELQKKLQEWFSTYSKMIIQEQVAGDECRVLVVRGEVIVAYHRVPPSIVWNGHSTIHQLIEYENKNNPLRKEDYYAPLSYIRVDDELVDFIKKQWYSANHILEEWKILQLRWNSNMWTGWTAREVTDILHEDTKKLCIEISKKLWLSICGIDILTKDFSKPLDETGGVILEINGTPWIWWDRELTSVNSGKRILEKLFFEKH
jgi:cyanophycin synthetase